MQLNQLIVLGLLQGVFEWLPVSSEAVVALTGGFFKIKNPIEVALFLHLGTVLAVMFYFRKDWIDIIRRKNDKMLKLLLISTPVSLVVAFPIYHYLKKVASEELLLLLTGFALLLTAYFHKKKLKLNISWKALSFLAGFLQGLSVVPGVSRSGSTVFGLSLGKLKGEEVLKTSYMMSVPVVLASSFFLFWKNSEIVLDNWPALVVSFATGVLTLKVILNWVKKVDFFKVVLVFALFCFMGAGLTFFL